MWLEGKIMFSIISWVCIAIVVSQIILINALLGFLLVVALGMGFLGDLIICWTVKKNHVDKLFEPVPPGMELGIVVTLTGLIDFVWATKKPYGKREFVYNGEEASYVNKGTFPIHALNGNYGSLVHENYDEEVNLSQARAANKIKEEFNSEDVEEIYEKIKNWEKKRQSEITG